MALQVLNLFKFRNFYNRMDFDSDQSLAIEKASIEPLTCQEALTRPLKVVEEEMKFEEDVVVFYKEDKKMPSKYHNKPLYVNTSIHDVGLRLGLVDPGYTLNIRPILAFETVEIAREHVVEQPTRAFYLEETHLLH